MNPHLHAVDPRTDYRRNRGILPGFRKPSEIVRAALPVLAPPARLTVSEAIERHVTDEFGKPISLDLTPYMREPADMTTSRGYAGEAFVGPARTGKTYALVEGQVAYRMVYDPCSMMVAQMDKDAARAYSRGKLEKLLLRTPDLRRQLVAARGSLGNIFDKYFRGGGSLELAWPVASKFASKDVQVTIATDRDKMPDDIEGEGDVFELMRKRGQTFGSRAFATAESSPRRDVPNDGKTPQGIHEMPACPGIIGLYNRGTRARYYWTCRHCGHEFEPHFGLMKFPDEGSIADRADAAWMACPGSGCVIEYGERYELNLAGRWLHESADGSRAVPIGDPDIRRSDIVSYAINGMHAAFQSWRDLVAKWLAAAEHFDLTGDESMLRTLTNVDLGQPYRPRGSGDAGFDADALLARADLRPLGTCPAQTRFVTVSVDVQGNRFVCQADAWGEGMERWLVDRWDIALPPPHAPGALDAAGKPRRSVEPHRYAEDWDGLASLHGRIFPVEGTGRGLMPAAVIIDSGGMPGVYEKALAFWRKRRRERLAFRLSPSGRPVEGVYMLYRGDHAPKAPRAKLRKPEAQNLKKRGRANDVDLVFVATDKIKDEVAASLSRAEPGPLSYRLTRALDRVHVEEFCAEERDDKGSWSKKASHLRNESLDLAVFGKAAAIVLGAEAIREWDAAPAWARGVADNSNAVAMAAAPSAPAEAPAAPQETKPKRSAAQMLADLRRGIHRP